MTPLHVWKEKEAHIEAYCNWLVGVENKLNANPNRTIESPETKPKRKRKTNK